LAGIAFNFQSTGRLVFGGALWTRIPRFVAVYALVCGLNIAGVSALLQADVNIYLANAVLILPLAVIGFMLQRRFVFAAP
jgi:putative flippase GtrA